ncbi:hypothetical protein NQ318_004098 [Aromia moschata]|uniref:RNase H type-1 domain-containing protein n=1 Tax=Aromia moschata TaxID=1265417 RepID=A0AAV8XWD8_9CUCU|nr:hypothetical protein NQ318_004098 [Aromia moschata]
MIRMSYTNNRIQIISDSQAALKALGSVEIHFHLVKDYMDSLIQLAKHNSITLKWVRGHQGHEGNERPDFVVKKGIPRYQTARNAIKDLLREKHTSHYAGSFLVNILERML